MFDLDWQGVLTGLPLQWIVSGFLTTVWVSLIGMALATVLAVLFLALRLAGGAGGRCGGGLGIGISQHAATGAITVLVFRRLESASADGA